MRAPLAIAAGAVLLAGCQTMPPAAACPAGQDYVRTAQLFFARRTGEEPRVSDDEFRRFVDAELTPRFREGLTVMDAGSQWRNDPDKLVSGAARVVVIVLPKGHDESAKIEAVRAAYRTRFHRDSVVRIGAPSCVAL
jgi:hypothetical protein